MQRRVARGERVDAGGAGAHGHVVAAARRRAAQLAALHVGGEDLDLAHVVLARAAAAGLGRDARVLVVEGLQRVVQRVVGQRQVAAEPQQLVFVRRRVRLLLYSALVRNCVFNYLRITCKLDVIFVSKI